MSAFVSVAETLNFRLAAERLNMTQPPLTRLIAKLEEDLGVKLFLRHTRKVELTAAGMSLLKDARDILQSVNEAKRSAKEAERVRSGTIRIGLTTAALYSSVMKAIWKFKESHPRVQLETFDGKVDEQMTRLKKSRIDLAIVQAPAAPHDEYSSLVLVQEALGVLVPDDHRLRRRKHISIQDLQGETLIMHDKKEVEGFYNSVVQLFRQEKTEVRFHQREQDQHCPFLVASGRGLLLTTQSLSQFAIPGTSFVPIKNEFARMSLAAYWSEKNESSALRSFLNFVENHELIRGPKSACLMSLANW